MGFMIALFTIAFSCEQLLSFWKKGSQRKPRQMGTKNPPFFKGLFGQVPKCILVHFLLCFHVLFHLFYDSIRTKNEKHVLLLFCHDRHENKYLPIRDNYYFIVSIWNRVTTVYFYHLLKNWKSFKIPVRWRLLSNEKHLNFRAKNQKV